MGNYKTLKYDNKVYRLFGIIFEVGAFYYDDFDYLSICVGMFKWNDGTEEQAAMVYKRGKYSISTANADFKLRPVRRIYR